MAIIDPRDMVLALRAKRHGANYSLRIVLEARRAGIPVSLGFALIEQESNFENVYGHDDVSSVPSAPSHVTDKVAKTLPFRGGPVTAANYRVYKARRVDEDRGMQGVGPAQLTWYSTQDAADRRGGCHVPRHNIAQAFATLANNIELRGNVRAGVRAYNGSGPAAERYAHQVMGRYANWHRFLKNTRP